jgi:hypothetical protein
MTDTRVQACAQCCQKMVIPPTPLTDAEVIKTMTDMEDVIRYRLRMHEIVPIEMAQHRIGTIFSECNKPPLTILLISRRPRLFHCTEPLRNFIVLERWPEGGRLVLRSCGVFDYCRRRSHRYTK